MTKLKRSERIVVMTHYLLQHPNQLISLSYFVERFSQAKSSISEDIQIIKDSFELAHIGDVRTIAGAAGGVIFSPKLYLHEAQNIVNNVCDLLRQKNRLLPGGYLFMSDIMGNPMIISQIGKLIATLYQNKNIDVIVTVATKGISLAHAVAAVLNVPVVVIRRDSKVTEGTTVSINYVSGSTRKIETMVLSKRTLQEGANVLLVDDFMKAGGSISGMMSLMDEFNACVKGIAVLVEEKDVAHKLIKDYTSVVRLSKIDEFTGDFTVEEGNSLQLLTEIEGV